MTQTGIAPSLDPSRLQGGAPAESSRSPGAAARGLAPVLWGLLGLFCLRVVAQAAQAGRALPWLPGFDAWHSGALPYPMLLAAQLAIASFYAATCLAFSSGRVRPSARAARIWLGLGVPYLGVMGVRVALGGTLLRDHPWFGQLLPGAFHLVLATFLVLVGAFHWRYATARSVDAPRSGLLAWIAYPAVMSGVIVLYLWLVGAGVPAHVGSYCAGALGALLVTSLELTAPHARAWQASWSDVRTDAVYMAAVQVLLPLGLAVTLSVYVLESLQALGVEPARAWPHAWPVVAQAALMLLAADFLRYWLHVASHRYEPLWRLHAVHHSPEKLYWLNVGRFHPIEKTLQYLLDALPFVLLGVAPEVLALYFVFYSVNGFFQHSNIELRFGALNYVISSAELHRWHHSRVAEESCANYGNNLIVWDLVFGTRFLPDDRECRDLGLPNRTYPTGFAAQLRAPLVRGIEQAPGEVLGWPELLANFLIRLRMRWVGLLEWPALCAAAREPGRTQRECLERILRANRDTEFGLRHGFATIESFDTYRERVPLQSYESLRSYVERQERTGDAALTSEPPIFYAQTSGTTDLPKYIPVLASSLRAHRRVQRLLLYCQLRTEPRAFDGALLAIASPAVEGHLPGGSPFGSTSGHVYRGMPRMLRRKHVLPYEVLGIADYELKYRTIARLALGVPNITYAAAANPSTFLKLLAVLREHRVLFLRDLEEQGFHASGELAPEVRAAIRTRLRCTPVRLEALRAVMEREDFQISDLWPELRMVATWTGGSCGVALEAVRRSLPEHTRVAEVGYLASELLGTLTVDVERRLGLPTLDQNVFEFVERERFEAGDLAFQTLEQLEEGREYYVIITTATGLYRYDMNDIVRVTGRFRATPTLAFVQKGRGVTNLTGEKLYEGQVIEAVRRVERAFATAYPFFLMLADVQDTRYTLWIEQGAGGSPPSAARVGEAVERELRRLNVEYAAKRASGRLAPLAVRKLRAGAGDAYKRHCVARGQRESQFKVQPLQPREQVDFDPAAFVVEEA